MTNLLLNADSGLAPSNPQFSDSNLDGAIADFDGSTTGQFNADFVVSERPLTTRKPGGDHQRPVLRVRALRRHTRRDRDVRRVQPNRHRRGHR